MTHPTIQWELWPKPPGLENHFGHGVHYHDIRAHDPHAAVAFIEGFEWMRNRNVVLRGFHIIPDSITTARVLAAMRRRIEGLVARQQLIADGLISRRIRALSNC